MRVIGLFVGWGLGKSRSKFVLVWLESIGEVNGLALTQVSLFQRRCDVQLHRGGQIFVLGEPAIIPQQTRLKSILLSSS